MKRQTLLASFGITKKVKYRNSDIEVKIPDFAKINEQRINFPPFYCFYCNFIFLYGLLAFIFFLSFS